MLNGSVEVRSTILKWLMKCSVSSTFTRVTRVQKVVLLRLSRSGHCCSNWIKLDFCFHFVNFVVCSEFSGWYYLCRFETLHHISFVTTYQHLCISTSLCSYCCCSQNKLFPILGSRGATSHRHQSRIEHHRWYEAGATPRWRRGHFSVQVCQVRSNVFPRKCRSDVCPTCSQTTPLIAQKWRRSVGEYYLGIFSFVCWISWLFELHRKFILKFNYYWI